MVGEIFLTIVFMFPLYGFLIWAYISPEDVLLFGQRWKYQEEPEFSSGVIRYIKFASVYTMIGSPIVLISMFLKSNIFQIVLMAFVFVLIVGAFLILTAERKS